MICVNVYCHVQYVNWFIGIITNHVHLYVSVHSVQMLIVTSLSVCYSQE